MAVGQFHEGQESNGNPLTSSFTIPSSPSLSCHGVHVSLGSQLMYLDTETTPERGEESGKLTLQFVERICIANLRMFRSTKHPLKVANGIAWHTKIPQSMLIRGRSAEALSCMLQVCHLVSPSLGNND